MVRKIRYWGFGLAIAVLVTVLLLHTPATAIHDKDNLGTYKIPGTESPDKELAGFFLNMGPTGARGILTDNSFIVKHVFKDSPAFGKLKLDDEVTGAFGKPFGKHTFGYLKHGYEGPIMDMGDAIEKAEGSDGKLALIVKRGSETLTVTVDLQPLGTFSSIFPFNCKKSQTLRANALKYLAEDPNAQIGTGSAHAYMAVTLALLTSEDPKQFALGKKMALSSRISDEELKKPVTDVGWSWYLSHPLITLSEYHMLTKDASVLPSIKYLSDGLANHSQWKAPIPTFPPLPDTPDKAEKQKELDWVDGGLGHVSFTGWKSRGGGGYGPMQMSTCIGVIAWQAAERCGVTTSPGAIARSIGYINRGTSASGAMAYGGYFKGWEKDTGTGSYVGKTAASLIVHQLSPEFEDSPKYIALSTDYMSKSYKSMPDGHACNNLTTFWTLMGAGASGDEKVLRSVMDYHKAYFNMMRCHDGSFALLPGRDFGDGGWFTSSRYHPTATMVLALGLDNPKLLVQGLQVSLPGVNPKALKGKADIAYKAVVKKNYAEAMAVLKGSSADDKVAQAMLSHIDVHAQLAIAKMEALEKAGDIASLHAELAKGQKTFGLLPSFKEKVSRFETAFREEAWKLELRVEANYRQLVGMLRRNKSLAYVGDLERFAAKYPDSLYGKWALEVAKEYRASSTVVEPRVEIASLTPPPSAAVITNEATSANSIPAKPSGRASATSPGAKDAKPANAAKKDSSELLAEYQQRMVRKLESVLSGGAKIEVWVSNWGPKRERYKLQKATDIGLVVQQGESLLPVPWNKLSIADRADLAKGVAKEDDVEALLISAVMQHLAGKTADAELALSLATVKNPEAAKKARDAIAGQ